MYSYVKRNEGKVMEHYLDNSATTKVSQKAAEKAFEIMTENYGNPSSLHLRGMYAEQELVKARKEVARKLGATADEIYFTSGGTEANNLAIFGVAEAKNAEESGLLCLPLNTAVLWNPQKNLRITALMLSTLCPVRTAQFTRKMCLKRLTKTQFLCL